VCVHTAKEFWSLCRVHTHGKGATCRPPVLLGAPGACLYGAFPCVADQGRTAKLRTAENATHGNVGRTAKYFGARQSNGARQRWQRTAKRERTAALAAHGRDGDARQRALPCIPCMRTAKVALPSKALPCKLCRECTHGKAVAVRIGLFAVQSFARQRLLFP
jgi:hypothetical protein